MMQEAPEGLETLARSLEQALASLDLRGKHLAAAHLDRCLHELRREPDAKLQAH